MKGGRKGTTPSKMLEWLNNASDDWKPAYPFDSSDVRNEVRSALFREQRGLCVYCGRKLDLSRPGETFHIEHFRPQQRYAHMAVDYTNLFLSCGQKDPNGQASSTCGYVKGDWFDEFAHVNPDYPTCTTRFSFTLNGFVETQVQGDRGAENMIAMLNLNHSELVKDRSDVLGMIDGGKMDETDFFDSEEGIADSLAHVVFQHLGKVMP